MAAIQTPADMRAVDDLLKTPVPGHRPGINAPVPVEREETTGVYDVSFFDRDQPKQVTPLQRLEDATVGIQIFLDEATKALEDPSDELTADQRIHVSTIATFIEALGKRFDRIRTPGYVQKGIRRVP